MKQPRRPPEPESAGKEEQSPPDLRNNTRSSISPGTPVQNESSGPMSQTGAQQSEPPEDGEYVQAIVGTPETIHYNLEPDADSETVDSGTKQTGHTVTHVTTTTTRKVQERKNTNAQKAELSATASEGHVQPWRGASTFSQTTAGQQAWSSVHDGVRRQGSSYQETHIPPVTKTSSASVDVQTRHYGVLPPSSQSPPSLEILRQIERSNREGRERIIDLMELEYKDAALSHEEQLKLVQIENETLLGEKAALTSRITVLEIQLTTHAHSHSEASTWYNEADSTINTTFTTITTTITTVTTRVERWTHAAPKNKGQVTISIQELQQLWSELSATSSQMTELQRRYAELSKDSSSVRHKLEVTLLLCEEKDRTITTLTTEVSQWKTTDASKAQQIQILQRDLDATSSRITELQQHSDAQSGGLSSVHNELKAKVSLIEERDRTITSLTAEVARLKQLNAEQIANARHDYEKLQSAVSASGSGTAELQKRYDAQSEELSSVRTQLKTKMSLIEERDRKFASLTAEVAQLKLSNAEQIADARRDYEKLQSALSASGSGTAELQKHYDAQSEEFRLVRSQLKTKVSLIEERDRKFASLITEVAQLKQSNAEQIADARRDYEKLRGDLSASRSMTEELQKSYNAQSEKLVSIQDKLQVNESLVEERDRKITTLTTEVDQWKHTADTKTQQLAAVRRDKEKLEQDLAALSSQTTDLQERHDTQSKVVVSVRSELQTKISLLEKQEHTITSLTTEVDQAKRDARVKEEQLATARGDIEQLRGELSGASSRYADLQKRHEAKLEELNSALDVIHQIEILYPDGIDQAPGDPSRKAVAQHIARGLEKKNKQMEELRRDLAAATSRNTELQKSYEELSREVSNLRDELRVKTSQYESTITTLTTRVNQSESADTAKEKQIATMLKQVEDLQRSLSTSSSKFAELQGRYDVQLRQFTAVQHELRTMTSSNTDKERTITTLTAEVGQWKDADAKKAEQIRVIREQAESFKRESTHSSSQIVELQQRYEARSAELTSQIEQSKRLNVELSTAHKKLEQLQHELSTSSTRIIELQQRCETQSVELNSLHKQLEATRGGGDRLNDQIEQLKRANADKEVKLTHARGDLEQLQAQLDAIRKSSVSDSKEIRTKITTEVKDYAAVIKLTTTVDEWLRADVKRAEELAIDLAKRAEELARELAKRNKENEELRLNLITLKDFYLQAPELKQIFQSETIEIQRRYEEQSRELKVALAERQSQLDGVQRFVTTADTYADTMIIQELQKLNAEVQQSTTYMAECIVEDFRPRTTKLTKDQTSATQRVSEYIGQTLVGCLGSKERDDVALYLPIAFQAYLTYHLRWIISSWTAEKGYNDLIDKIYGQLQESEAQSVSGRWRFLTRTYIPPTLARDQNALTLSTVAGLSDIVVAAGCATTLSSANSKVSSKFGDKVSAIISIAGRFSKMIGEVVSADFEVMAVRPPQVFEEITMEEDVDDYDKGQGMPGAAIGERVLCSTHLGMTKRMEMESGKKDTLTVVKAKVVLESFLDGGV